MYIKSIKGLLKCRLCLQCGLYSEVVFNTGLTVIYILSTTTVFDELMKSLILLHVCVFIMITLFIEGNARNSQGTLVKWLRCLSCNLGIVGSNTTRVTTMIPQMTPVLVGSRKLTQE